MKPLVAKVKTWFACSLLVVASIAVALLFGELLARYTRFTPAERSQGAARLWAEYENTYVRNIQNYNGCSFSDTLVPHPFFGYVHGRLPPCNYPLVNNRGLQSHGDIPDESDPEAFTILLLGGSVASQLALGKRGNPKLIWLEEYLNAHFISPNGKPFKVLGGGAGGWRLPTQLNIVALYGGSVDAVVAVDGYNEATTTAGGGSIFSPPTREYLYTTYSYSTLSFWTIKASQKYRRAAYGNPVVKRSFLAYLSFRSLVDFLLSNSSLTRFGYEAVDRFFEFTPPKTREKTDIWNKNKFKEYIRLLHANAQALNIRYAHFLQPIMAIDKELTADEKLYPHFVSAEHYRKVYLDAVNELNREKYLTYSLTDVFKGIRESIYGDHIHCKFESDMDSPGYKIMSGRIGAVLAKAWHLRRRATSSGDIPGPSPVRSNWSQ